MNFYPSHRILLEDTHIVRKHSLPPGMVGDVLIEEGEIAPAKHLLVAGTRPSDYQIIDIAGPLKLDPEDDEALKQVLDVEVGQPLDAGTPLVNNRRYRRRVPKAPADSVVLLVEHGHVILQVNPEIVEVHATFRGMVTAVEPRRGVTLEAQGMQLQCAWGNGRLVTASFEFEPGLQYSPVKSGSLNDLLGDDMTLSPYRGKVVVLLRPLNEIDLVVVEQQELAGIVAPCALVDLREKAMQLKVPVILTEGFGYRNPTMRLYELLLGKRGNQAVFDAVLPDLRHNTRPEIIVPVGLARPDKERPQVTKPLEVGMLVHIRRAPYTGRLGEITQLPELPVTIENGLRVPCAHVKLESGERVIVPLANLDSIGA
ncbi:MAG: hypothetical protein K8I82_02190 [Anaerolineae bacterium]|nr:hypothetical protein [Anaerolineae bacterium]